MSHAPLLIVDDEPANLAAMRQVLGGTYELVFARNGTEALAAALKHRPSLVLLDIGMPDLDGYAVCRRLKADKQTEAIPVIFVTALADIGNEAAGFEAGGVDYIIKPISPSIVRARVRTHLSLVRAATLQDSYRDAIYMLGTAGHYNDTDTGVHIWRMAVYARALAEASGWDAEQCHLIELAAPMHDTGKLGVSDAILGKPGPLDPVEWKSMQTHARIGHEILVQSEAPVFKMAAEIALHHHEKWNGSGYPAGLKGEDIPESARIVAVADVFDALAMKRPYKEIWPLDQIVETLKSSRGSHFEPRLVDLFLGIMPKILEIKATWDRRETAEHKQAG